MTIKRRGFDFRNAFCVRYVLFVGLDDVAPEGLYLDARGWVWGRTKAFPRGLVDLVHAFDRGDHAKAMAVYRWFMPLLHLDAGHALVKSIRLRHDIVRSGGLFSAGEQG